MYYQQHLFFCVNLRQSGKRCCGQQAAQEACQYAKATLKRLGQYGPGKCRVSSSGCLGRCDEGPVLVAYPEGVFYRYTSNEDVQEIIDSHVLGGKKVERLLLPHEFPDKAL